MRYGDERCVHLGPGTDPEGASRAVLSRLLDDAEVVSRFASTPDRAFIHDVPFFGIDGVVSFRVDADCLMEINDAFLREPLAISNRVSDVISFQFVSSVKRSEYLGKRRNVHDMGPAIIVSVVPRAETTYRVPKTGVPIRTAVVHTTLSTLLDRMGEDPRDYPRWLLESIGGEHRTPRQRVYFLEDVHREAIWSCFHLPVTGSLLGHWMTAKFHELLAIGLQILKRSRDAAERETVDADLPQGEKIRKARTLLSMEYANPPSLPELARQLGISETRLKSGFKSMNGTTVMQYCIHKRIEAAKLLLRENRHSISEIGDIVGYEDHSAFTRAFRRLTGHTPREWRRARRE